MIQIEMDENKLLIYKDEGIPRRGNGVVCDGGCLPAVLMMLHRSKNEAQGVWGMVAGEG